MSIEGTFTFDPEDPIYGEHFPGYAVVPGSLIVGAFLGEADKVEGGVSPFGLIENFRFLEFVAPGAYPFSMEKAADGIRCRLYHKGKTVVTGILKKAP
jgi:3-hydroxyacyl-[acyl-carrier-protein] dehydratase